MRTVKIPDGMSDGVSAHGRAVTPEQKRKVMERALAAWEQVPEQRFVQFMLNATGVDADPFYVEDEAMAELCEAYARECRRP